MSNCETTTKNYRNIAARVYSAIDQEIPSGPPTVLSFELERFDTDEMHESVTDPSRLTIRTGGKYQISAMVQFAAAAVGAGTLRSVAIRLNGTTIIAQQAGSSAQDVVWGASLSTLYQLKVGDFLEVVVEQDSGVALNVEALGNFSPEFAAVRVARSGNT